MEFKDEHKKWQQSILRMHASLTQWEVGTLGKQTFSLAFDPVVDGIKVRMAEKNRNTLQHETEASRLRHRSAREDRFLKQAMLGKSKSTSNLASKGFNVALNHKAPPKPPADPIVIYNLPTATEITQTSFYCGPDVKPSAPSPKVEAADVGVDRSRSFQEQPPKQVRSIVAGHVAGYSNSWAERFSMANGTFALRAPEETETRKVVDNERKRQ